MIKPHSNEYFFRPNYCACFGSVPFNNRNDILIDDTNQIKVYSLFDAQPIAPQQTSGFV